MIFSFHCGGLLYFKRISLTFYEMFSMVNNLNEQSLCCKNNELCIIREGRTIHKGEGGTINKGEEGTISKDVGEEGTINKGERGTR